MGMVPRPPDQPSHSRHSPIRALAEGHAHPIGCSVRAMTKNAAGWMFLIAAVLAVAAVVLWISGNPDDFLIGEAEEVDRLPPILAGAGAAVFFLAGVVAQSQAKDRPRTR